MTWRVNFVHIKDAQKQLTRTSLSIFCLSFTPISCLLHSPAIVLVMLYSSLFLPFSAAFSAAALFCIQPLLTSLALLFNSLSFALYSSLPLCFSRHIIAPSIFSFASFLDLFPRFVSYPCFALLFRPSDNFLCNISVR